MSHPQGCVFLEPMHMWRWLDDPNLRNMPLSTQILLSKLTDGAHDTNDGE